MNNQNNENQLNDNLNENNSHQNIININQINIFSQQNNQPQEYSFSRYKKAPRTGLINMGHTSYLNSVLQLLGCIRSLASHFLNPKNNEIYVTQVKRYPLSYVIYRLFFHLYPFPVKIQREFYQPTSLKEILSMYNIAYCNNEENSPNLLIGFILNKLHDELNVVKFKDNYTFYDFIMNMKLADDRDTVINKGLQFFCSNNNSLIFNYFNWFEIKEISCQTCSQTLYDFLSYPTFELNALEWAKYKHMQNINIRDCLDFYIITKIKKRVCQYCQKYNEVSITTKIYSSPNIFVFLLNLESEDNNINFIIEREINLEKYIENNNSPTNYELTGMVFKDIKKNKYKAFCKSPADKKWYLYDDEKVKLTAYDEFMKEYESTINYKPCILLYILQKKVN